MTLNSYYSISLSSTWDAVVGLLGEEQVAACELSDGRVLADVNAGTHDALAVDKERQAERQVCAAGRKGNAG